MNIILSMLPYIIINQFLSVILTAIKFHIWCKVLWFSTNLQAFGEKNLANACGCHDARLVCRIDTNGNVFLNRSWSKNDQRVHEGPIRPAAYQSLCEAEKPWTFPRVHWKQWCTQASLNPVAFKQNFHYISYNLKTVSFYLKNIQSTERTSQQMPSGCENDFTSLRSSIKWLHVA